jgi:hypothetical protein
MALKSINHRNIILNSALLFIICALLHAIFHESGHLLSALTSGAGSIVMYHNAVIFSIDNLSTNDIIFIKASGPNISLLTGLIFHYICFTHSTRNLFFLFSLYMAVFGYIGCFGYVMIAPFFIYGDTGYIFYLLDIPIAITILISIVSAVFLFLLMKNLTRYYVEMGTKEVIENNAERKIFINALIVYPLIIGVIISGLLSLPAHSFLSIFAPVFGPFARYKKYESTDFNRNIRSVDKFDILWLVVFLLIVNLNRLLSGGMIIN